MQVVAFIGLLVAILLSISDPAWGAIIGLPCLLLLIAEVRK